MRPDKKLRYLKRFMNRWIDDYPNMKDCSFEFFVESQERKRRMQSEADIVKNVVAKGVDSSMKKCFYCERRFFENRKKTRDHIIPISNGGTSESNIVFSCETCNS